MDSRVVKGVALKMECVKLRGFEPHSMHKVVSCIQETEDAINIDSNTNKQILIAVSRTRSLDTNQQATKMVYNKKV